MEDGTNEHDYELNQFENAAQYVRRGHTITEAAVEFGVDACLLVRFIEVNFSEGE